MDSIKPAYRIKQQEANNRRKVHADLHIQQVQTLSALFINEHLLVSSARLEPLRLTRSMPILVVGITVDCPSRLMREVQWHSSGRRSGRAGK